MVRDVFEPHHMLKLMGNLGIGHVRYPTSGASSAKAEAQPMYNNFPCGLALAHNGNLTNMSELQAYVRSKHRHLNTNSDTEVLLNVWAEELRSELDSRQGSYGANIEPEAIFAATQRTMARCKGGYSVVMLVHDVGVVAFRDPWGIRPLTYGQRKSATLEMGVDYMFASESCALSSLGFSEHIDVKPGECVLCLPMDKPRADKGFLKRQLVGTGNSVTSCLFEYVYFAREDSVMNKVPVHKARQNMGVKLAEKVLRNRPKHGIDVVVPVPATSCTSAKKCAETLGLPYVQGLVKNHYIGRTFIMPGQEKRKKSVRLKLNPIPSEFKDKVVLLVDDSIVRGTTSREIISMVRECGAKKIFFASAAPPIRYPNVYGIDLPARKELVAYNRTEEEIAEYIGCEWVVFQDLEALEATVRAENPALDKFESSTFNGVYVTEDIDDAYFEKLETDHQTKKKKAETAGQAHKKHKKG